MSENVGTRTVIKAVLFDKDGTLFDLNATWAPYCERLIDIFAPQDRRLRHELARRCGYDPENRRLERSSIVVAGAADELTQAFCQSLPDWSATAIEQVTRDALIGLPVEPLANNLPALLSRLRKAGLKLGVATNDFREGATRQLAQAGILETFDFICGSDSGFGAKPSPGMINAFARHIGCAPSEIVMVGDSLHDVKSGLAAGCARIIAVATGYETADTLSCLTPDVLDALDDLPAILKC